MKTYAAGNEETIYNFLKNELGLNTAAACGVLANIEKESNFRPNLLEGGYTWASGGGYGICQWTNTPRTSSSGRRTNLVSFCNSHGYDYTSLMGQLYFLKHELETNVKPGVYSYLKSVSNTAQGAYDAGYKWCYNFEVPTGYNTGVSVTRGNLARNTYWSKYSGTPDPELVTPTITTDKSSYNVGDTIYISWIPSPSGSNLSHYWLQIDGPDGWYPYAGTMNLDTSYSFVASKVGDYTIKTYATPKGSKDGEGSLTDVKTISVTNPVPAPTYSNLTANKPMIAIGEEITFTASSDYATGFTVGIDNEISRYITQEMPNGSLTLTFNQTGNYSAYVTSYNSAGYADSSRINFRVYDSSAINIGDSFYAKIKNQSSNLYFTNTGSTINGQNVSDSNNQIWKFERQADNSYKIISQYDGLPMDVLGAETADGTDIRTWTDNGLSAQRYCIYNKFDSYYIRPVCSDKFVDMAIGAEDKNVATWGYGENWEPQKFDIEKIDAEGALPVSIGDSFYAKIKNQSSNLYFTNTGSTINGQTASDSDNQIWKFERQTDNSYKIISQSDGLPMDVLGAETADGTDIRTWTNNGLSAQRYYIYNIFNSYYIRSLCSDKFVDMAIGAEGKNIATWGYGADWEPQKFDIERIDADGALPVSIGDSFYAKIKNQSSNLYFTNTGSTINGQSVSDSSNQVWKFERQADNSYKIISQYDGLPMDVLGAETSDGTDIRTWMDNGLSAQRYYIYSIFNSYYIRPLCSDKFVDMSIESTKHNVATWGYGANWEPQKFDIIKVDSNVKNKGDVNYDGKVNVADAVMLQKWLLAVPNAKLVNWKAADLCEDNRIDVFDLCMLKNMLIERT